MFQVKIRSAITALLVAASIAPAAYATPNEPGFGAVRPPSGQGVSPATDLRSPDARNGATWAQMSRVQAPSAPQVVSAGTSSSSSGFQWDDAGIGAAGMLVLMSLGASAVLLPGRHRRRRGRPVATS
jgi:hypothetical protein